MGRFFAVVLLLIPALMLSACTGMIEDLNSDWATKNRVVSKRLGEKRYDGLTKDEAISAMIVALQRLDLTLDNANVDVGLVTASAPSPSPLTKAKMETVIEVENPNAQSIEPGLVWNLNDFESYFSVTFIEYSGGVQVNIQEKLRFVGDRNSFLPVNQFPPKALEIGLKKIWDEFEKIAFIQEKTLE